MNIKEYLAEHPDSTTDEIAEALGLDWIQVEIQLEDIADERWDFHKGYIWSTKDEL